MSNSQPTQFQITNPARVLSTPFKTVSQAVPTKSAIPILEGILFQLTTEGLTLTGCDAEMWIIVRVPMEDKVSSPVSFVLPKKVADAILRLPDGMTFFEFHPERLNLKINYGPGGKNTQTHQVLRGEDYIQIPDVQGEEFTLKDINLKKVSFAVSTDGARPIMGAVNINFEARKIAATDSFRAAIMDIPENGNIAIPAGLPKINVPARMINLMAAMDEPRITVGGSGTGGSNSGGTGNNLIKAKSDDETDTIIISRLVPGQYPLLQPIVASLDKLMFLVEFSSREMLDTLSRVAPILSSGQKMLKFIFRGGEGDNYISVSTQSEFGSVFEDIPFKLVGGEIQEQIMSMVFDIKFVVDALKHAGSDRVTWGITGKYSPSVVRAAGSDSGDGWLCIIVPGRVSEE